GLIADIQLELRSPNGDSLMVSVEPASGGTETEFSTLPGMVSVGQMMTLEAGDYHVRVYPQSTGSACVQDTIVNIGSEVPVVQAVNDTFETVFGMQLFENMTSNDIGLNLVVLVAGNVIGGSLTTEANGDFIFTPSDGFFGQGSFDYAVFDACSVTDFGSVVINVAPPFAEPEEEERGIITTFGASSLQQLFVGEIPEGSIQESTISNGLLPISSTYIRGEWVGLNQLHRVQFDQLVLSNGNFLAPSPTSFFPIK
ncbi:MAG: Ig-like domain-containing protein, partial [Bacteroidota bacterium]